MRILIDTIAAHTGGGPVRTRELARTFPVLRPDNRFRFVLQSSLAPEVRELAPGVETVSPPAAFERSPQRLLWEHLALPRASRSFRPEVVFSPFNILPTRWSDPRPRLAVIVSNLCPYAPEVRDRYRGAERLRLEALRRLTDATVRRADHVFLLSEQGWSLLDGALNRERTQVIPMAPPPLPATQPVQPVQADGATSPYFLIATDLYRYKGVEMVVEAIAREQPGHRPTVLVCGRPLDREYVSELNDLIARHGMRENVRLLGQRHHGVVMTLLRGARGCIVPSRFENLSRVPIEAMAAGIPVVATDVPAYRESCGDAAAYFRVDDIDGLAEILRALREDRFHEDLRSRGRERIASVGAGDASAQILDTIDPR
jgi:glycosyltransferase involved in cell wall biosynthesis